METDFGSALTPLAGERLVNFDLKVVGENASSSYFRAPISYNRGTNTCTLTCHNFSHNADGSVTPAISPKTSVPAKH